MMPVIAHVHSAKSHIGLAHMHRKTVRTHCAHMGGGGGGSKLWVVRGDINII
jgi:hypothetical protein